MSHAELWDRVDRLTLELRNRGVRRGVLVGLCLQRSPTLLVAQLAVLQAGAAYVPLDPNYPAERLAHMAEDSGLKLIIAASAASLPRLDWPRERLFCVDEDTAWRDRPAGAPIEPDEQKDARAEDPAYVIYTSGSTGKPKGVVVPHRSVVNFLTSMAREPGLRSEDRLVAVTTLSFDIAVLELLLPLSVGATILMADDDEVLDGGALRHLLESGEATAMQATPSTWRLLLGAGWSGGTSFKALIGGEALPQDLAAALCTRVGELWNMYGPTETTVWSTCGRVVDPAAITVGRPIANTQIYVLDRHDQVCPTGVVGEICIGGDGVASGYWRRDELTAERFRVVAAADGARLYRTGDRGRWLADGRLEHLGRFDFQVKIRGYRIELGEIEAVATSFDAVRECVAVARARSADDVRLIAYVVWGPGRANVAGLREHLRARLPGYMVPQAFVELDAIPLLPNGKINRQALPDALDVPEAATHVASELDERERVVARIWCDLLGVAQVGRADNFFDLGGHSLLAVQASARMSTELGITVPVRRLIFESLGQIAATTPAHSDPPSTRTPDGSWLGRLMRVITARGRT